MPSAHPPAPTRPAAKSPDHRSRSGNGAVQPPWWGSWSGRPCVSGPALRGARPTGQRGAGVAHCGCATTGGRSCAAGRCAITAQCGATCRVFSVRRAGGALRRYRPCPGAARLRIAVRPRGQAGRSSPNGRRPRGPWVDTMASVSSRLDRGRAHHDPNHGLRVPTVTLVGVWWSVVGSGSEGCLQVSNILF